MKRLLAAVMSVVASASPAHATGSWAVVKHEYKGFPLYLRYPVGLDYDALQPLYPLRIVVTLKFAQKRDDGLPESGYNRSLEAFDEFVVGRLSGMQAQCVLVETFGGKRIFYAYAAHEAVASELRADLERHYPEHAVTVELQADPTWSLIRNYAGEYFPKPGAAQAAD